jgi:hypothetical protein
MQAPYRGDVDIPLEFLLIGPEHPRDSSSSNAHQPHGYEDLGGTELGGTKSVPSALMLGRVKDINGHH